MKSNIKLLSFLLLSLIICSCGKNVPSIKIGDQIWQSENLDVVTFRNGDTIPEVKTNAEWSELFVEQKPGWCYYDNNQQNGIKFGKLYNWYAVHDPRGLAPKGWHIPSKAEFETLENSSAVNENSNTLKAIGQGSESGAGTNSSGFSALLAGYRDDDGYFNYLGFSTTFWSSTEYSSGIAYLMYLWTNDSYIYMYDYNKNYGFSVRCVKD